MRQNKDSWIVTLDNGWTEWFEDKKSAKAYARCMNKCKGHKIVKFLPEFKKKNFKILLVSAFGETKDITQSFDDMSQAIEHIEEYDFAMKNEKNRATFKLYKKIGGGLWESIKTN